MAVKANPEAHSIFHSDRVFQYTSSRFIAKLQKAGMTRRISRVEKCIDNEPMEEFKRIIKAEIYYLNCIETFEELGDTITHKLLQL